MEGRSSRAGRADGPPPAPAVSLPALSRSFKTTLEMIKFSHTLFALPFALLAAVLAARGLPSWPTLAKILLAMVGARSAAMSHNRLTDHAIDAANPRTASRALPSGAISAGFVRIFLAGSVVLFLLAAASLNRLTFALSPLALALLFIYSYTKRFTWLSHVVLGLCLALAPVGAWIAVQRRLRVDSDPSRARGPALDGRLRYPLRPSGRGARPPRRAEVRAGALGNEERARGLGRAARGDDSPARGRLASLGQEALSLPPESSRPPPRSSTSTPSSSPETSRGSTPPSSPRTDSSPSSSPSAGSPTSWCAPRREPAPRLGARSEPNFSPPGSLD